MKIFKFGFTLAEVLITLAIIGVVAALTLPTLITNYQKHVVETKLVKFHATMNQAIKLAEATYGDRENWYDKYITKDDNGVSINSGKYIVDWWQKYISPNLITTNIEYDENGTPTFFFPNGSALKPGTPTQMVDWDFYTIDPKKCEEKNPESAYGICKFSFIYIPAGGTAEWWKYNGRNFEAYKYKYDGKRETLITGEGGYKNAACNKDSIYRAYCTALIELNNWKIPDDYPFKVH